MAQITLNDTERAVVRIDGEVVRVLGAGRHRLPPRGVHRRRQVQRVDVRLRLMLVIGQELACADLPGIRVTAALTWRVSDPVAFLDVAGDPQEQLRLSAQLALRDVAARRTLDELTGAREPVGAELLAAVTGAAAEVGAQVVRVELRDVVVPGELRRALIGVATARQDGLAALERARGETAALRALANVARVLAEHPGLLQLRTAQVVAGAGGTVVLRTDPAPEPVSGRLS